MLDLDREIMSIMETSRPTPQMIAHMGAAICAYPMRVVNGEIIASKTLYQENYDYWYSILIKEVNKDA